MEEMEKRSRRRTRDLVTQAASQGLSQNEIGCARISMMARSTNAPCKGRIQMRKTNPLHFFTFGLQRTAGPYSWVKLPHGAKTASCPFLHCQRTRFLLCAAGHIFLPLRNNSLPRLTDQGLQKINDLAQHYGVSADAVMTLLQALLNSKGTMAQFDHRELGGAGQWMPGGMTMVGDMFNHGLKAKVDGLCSELSQLLAMQPFVPFPAGFQSQSQRQGGGQQEGGHDVLDTGSVSLFVPETPGRASGEWWPAELGFPNGTGAQNQVRYAYFNQKRRLAVELNGHVTVYDTLDHQISGVSQQQGRGGSLTLTSQHGTVIVSTLPASVDGVQTKAPEPRVAPASEPYRPNSAQETDLFAKIERLAELHKKGILSSEEFAAKKT